MFILISIKKTIPSV